MLDWTLSALLPAALTVTDALASILAWPSILLLYEYECPPGSAGYLYQSQSQLLGPQQWYDAVLAFVLA